METRSSTCSIVLARAHASEKSRNIASETSRTCFLPKTSDQRPYNGVQAKLVEHMSDLLVDERYREC